MAQWSKGGERIGLDFSSFGSWALREIFLAIRRNDITLRRQDTKWGLVYSDFSENILL